MSDETVETRCIVHGGALNRDEVRTCNNCIGKARSCLHQVFDLLALVPAETTERGGTSYDGMPTGARELAIPGGDALVMLSPGSDARQQTRDILSDNRRIGERRAASHAEDELKSDPLSIPFELTRWEDDWRSEFGHGGAPTRGDQATAKAHEYLMLHLVLAARTHPGFDEFVLDMKRARAQLAAITRTDMPRTRSVAHCLADECSGMLQREWDDLRNCSHRQPCRVCDHGGRRENWECNVCGRLYTEDQHSMACMEQVVAHRAAQRALAELEAAS